MQYYENELDRAARLPVSLRAGGGLGAYPMVDNDGLSVSKSSSTNADSSSHEEIEDEILAPKIVSVAWTLHSPFHNVIGGDATRISQSPSRDFLWIRAN